MKDFEFSYPAYLDAKESVDERSLNRRVEAEFYDRILSTNSERLRVLEVGGGTGATLLRILDHLRSKGLQSLQYTFVERRADNIKRARARIREWAADSSYVASSNESGLELTSSDERGGLRKVVIELIQADFLDDAVGLGSERFDAVVAQALLDQIDLEVGMRKLDWLLTDGGIWYLPIHFDGLTGFEPTIDRQLDDQITSIYDRSIPHPKSGRQLLSRLPGIGSRIAAAGSSDWVVFSKHNTYPNNDHYFLKCILSFVEQELLNQSEISDDTVSRWVESRRQQIEDCELMYIAHQLDICAEKTS